MNNYFSIYSSRKMVHELLRIIPGYLPVRDALDDILDKYELEVQEKCHKTFQVTAELKRVSTTGGMVEEEVSKSFSASFKVPEVSAISYDNLKMLTEECVRKAHNDLQCPETAEEHWIIMKDGSYVAVFKDEYNARAFCYYWMQNNPEEKDLKVKRRGKD